MFPEGNVQSSRDNSQRSLQKIVGILAAGGGGGGGTANIVGTGSPEGVETADPGTVYFDDSSDQFWYKKTGTGNTGWQQLG